MKKNLLLLTLIILIASSLFVTSCKHDVTCDTLGFKLEANATNASDATSGDGKLEIKLNGGTGFSCQVTQPYNNNNSVFESTESNEIYNITGLDTGTYTITARNSFGCIKSNTVVISAP